MRELKGWNTAEVLSVGIHTLAQWALHALQGFYIFTGKIKTVALPGLAQLGMRLNKFLSYRKNSSIMVRTVEACWGKGQSPSSALVSAES